MDKPLKVQIQLLDSRGEPRGEPVEIRGVINVQVDTQFYDDDRWLGSGAICRTPEVAGHTMTINTDRTTRVYTGPADQGGTAMPQFTDAPAGSLARLEAQRQATLDHAADLALRIQEIKRYGEDDYEDGNVILFERQFQPGGRVYSYAAIKSEGLWYTTGPRSPKGFRWDELAAWWAEAPTPVVVFRVLDSVEI